MRTNRSDVSTVMACVCVCVCVRVFVRRWRAGHTCAHVYAQVLVVQVTNMRGRVRQASNCSPTRASVLSQRHPGHPLPPRKSTLSNTAAALSIQNLIRALRPAQGDTQERKRGGEGGRGRREEGVGERGSEKQREADGKRRWGWGCSGRIFVNA